MRPPLWSGVALAFGVTLYLFMFRFDPGSVDVTIGQSMGVAFTCIGGLGWTVANRLNRLEARVASLEELTDGTIDGPVDD